MTLLLGNFTLLPNGTTIVNEPRSPGHNMANLIILVTTVIINIWAAAIIRRMERTSLHFAIVCDCTANILNIAVFAFLQSPWYKLGNSEMCTAFQFIILVLFTWNSISPLAIAIFRYMMVCHAVFWHNHGGERTIWRLLNSFIFSICLASGIIACVTSSSSKTYLRCINQEESFRRDDLQDFYQPIKTGGIELMGSFWSPHRFFFNVILRFPSFLVAVLYGAVFVFRKKYTANIRGKCWM